MRQLAEVIIPPLVGILLTTWKLFVSLNNIFLEKVLVLLKWRLKLFPIGADLNNNWIVWVFLLTFLLLRRRCTFIKLLNLLLVIECNFNVFLKNIFTEFQHWLWEMKFIWHILKLKPDWHYIDILWLRISDKSTLLKQHVKFEIVWVHIWDLTDFVFVNLRIFSFTC